MGPKSKERSASFNLGAIRWPATGASGCGRASRKTRNHNARTLRNFRRFYRVLPAILSRAKETKKVRYPPFNINSARLILILRPAADSRDI
jgi:hypothetical protein